MKLVAMMVALLGSSLAFAYPALNDSVQLKGEIVAAGQTYPLMVQMTITDTDGEATTYLKETTVDIAGSVEVSEEWMKESDMVTEEMVQQVMSTCALQGGELETVEVPAGTFETCAIPWEEEKSQGVTWLGDVPFGVVQTKSAAKDGSQESVLKLESVVSEAAAAE